VERSIAALLHCQTNWYNPPMRLRVTSMTYGPHGIGRHGGKAVFVRGVAPGEDVEVDVREPHASFDYAELREIVRPSPSRRQPPCRYLPRCGGCPWQHLDYSLQLEAKSANLHESLRRIAGMPELTPRPILTAGEELGYRSRLTLRVEAGEVGFYAAASHDLVTIDACLLASPTVAAALPAAATLAAQLSSRLRRLEIAERGFAAGVVFHGEVEGKLAASDSARLDTWLQQQPVAGVTLAGKGWRRVWGDDRIAIRPEPDLELITRAGTFTQVNPAANQRLVAEVIALAEINADEAILDVYAGAGNLSLPLARRARRVVAIEQDLHAAADARAAAAAAGLTGFEVVRGIARRALQAQIQASAYYDTIVLDPPRSGAAEVIDSVLRLSPRKLVYVSCNPTTLARDLKELARKFRIDVVQPIDLFPQTYHLETVVRATRR